MISKTVRQNSILLLGSLSVCILLAEVLLRIVFPAPISWKFPQEYYDYDPDIGHKLRPNQTSFTHDMPVKTNSVGIRDSEFSAKPNDSVIRVIALGDSQTFGNGLDLSETWPKQLEYELNGTNNSLRWEVINAGLSSSDTWQHEIILERMISNYNPNVAVLAFYINDVSKRFVPRPTQGERSNTSGKRIAYILKQSSILLAMRAVYTSAREMIKPSRNTTYQLSVLQGEFDAGWAQVKTSLSGMKQTTDMNNMLFIIAVLPRRDQVSGQITEMDYFERLNIIADEIDIPMISMLQPLKNAYTQYGQDLFIAWDGHNSSIANKIISKEISLKLTSLMIQQDQSASTALSNASLSIPILKRY